MLVEYPRLTTDSLRAIFALASDRVRAEYLQIRESSTGTGAG